ncbi:MAG: hypothetical protein ABIR68_18605 [Ilumatobacteraceae bacterium]
MRFVRRSAPVAPLLALVALVALGGCGSDGKSLTHSSTPTSMSVAGSSTSVGALAPVPDGDIVTSSVATPDQRSTTTIAAADGSDATTTQASAPAIVTSSVVSAKTSAPSTTTAGGEPAAGSTTATTAATATSTVASTTPATAAGAPGSTTPGRGDAVPDDTTPTATGNPTAFCAFEADIEDATNTDDDQVFITALRSFEPKMTQWEADAPTVQLRLAATKLHTATTGAIAANTTDAFNGDALNDAFLPISLFCGSLDGPTSA